MKYKGFTLVELLVVISIIAILSTIGMVVFTTVQQIARDGKRVADIDAIAKSLETAKDFTTGIYYNKLNTDFPNGIPTDPKGVTKYCILLFSSRPSYIDVLLDTIASSGWESDCPLAFEGRWDEISGAFREGIGDIRYWVLCAKKESNAEFYCKRNLSQ